LDATFDRLFYPEGELIAGVDESGVTDIAGPLVAACVILPKIDLLKHDLRIFDIQDCKVIPEKYRKQHAAIIWEVAIAIGIGEVQPCEADVLYKYNGASLAMIRAILACKTVDLNKPIQPDFLIIDGEKSIPIGIKQAPIATADKKSLCVAAAGIVAKVYRDDIMMQLHQRFPYYKWNKNKGYPCQDHFAGLDKYGIQAGIHRVKRWPFVPGIPRGSEPLSVAEEKSWKERVLKWQTTTLQKLTEEAGGKDLWTTNPQFSKDFMSSSRPCQKTHQSSPSTESLDAK